MKRDMKIIKALLEYVQGNANGSDILTVPNGDDLKSKSKVSDEIIHYHVELCVQARLLKVIPEDKNLGGTLIPVYGIVYLTWWGHDFLERKRHGQHADWSLEQLEAHR